MTTVIINKYLSIKESVFLFKEIVDFRMNFFLKTKKSDKKIFKITSVSILNNIDWKHKADLKERIKIMLDRY